MDKILEIVKKVAVALLILLLVAVFIVAVIAAVLVWSKGWWLAVCNLLICGIAAPVIWNIVSNLWPYLK